MLLKADTNDNGIILNFWNILFNTLSEAVSRRELEMRHFCHEHFILLQELSIAVGSLYRVLWWGVLLGYTIKIDHRNQALYDHRNIIIITGISFAIRQSV